MRGRDYGDIAAGTALISFGLFAAIYATSHYSIGSVGRMGPGMFPTGLGYLLVALGALIVVRALFRSGEFPRPEWRPLLTILAGITAFSLIVGTFGMVPAIVALTVLAARADDKLSFLKTLALAAGLSLTAALIFNIALGVPGALFNWPF